jgi:RNA polymerase sigma factor (sigma-70 family)
LGSEGGAKNHGGEGEFGQDFHNFILLFVLFWFNGLHPLHRKRRAASYNLFRCFDRRRDFGQSEAMNPPDLRALQQGDEAAWDAAFGWLWPTVFAVAQLKLQPFLPDEVEDMAIEALEILVDKVCSVKSVEELKPLAASIAHHRAVSLLRERFAQKRGAGKTESLDAPVDDGETKHELASGNSPLADLEQKELAQRLGQSLTELKPPQGEILSDFFLQGLRYEEIAKKRGVAVGSVGVYLKRGLEAMRRIWGREENS